MDRFTLFLLALTACTIGFSIRAVEPMLPVMAADFAVSVPVAGNIITLFSLAYGLGQFLHGPIGDRYGKLRMLTAWMLASAFALLATATAGSLGTLGLWRALTGAVCSAPFILGLAYIGDTVPIEQRQAVVAHFVTGNVLGHAFGPLVAGAMTDAFGWRAMFLLLGITLGAVALLLFFSTRARWPSEPKGSGRVGMIAGYASVLRLPRARTMAWCAMMESLFFFGAFAYVGAMLKERFDLSYTLIGLALAGFGVGGLAFNVGIRWIARRLKGPSRVLYGGFAGGLCFLGIAWLPAWQLAYPLMIGVGFSFYMVHNVLQVRATEAAPQARGAGLSLFGLTWMMGQALGVAIMGAGAAVFGFAPMIAAYGVGFALVGTWMRVNFGKLP